MENYRSIRSILGATFFGAAVCTAAWSEEIKVVTEPATPDVQVTTITQAAPGNEADKTVQYHHESVMDVDGNIVDAIVVKLAPPEIKKEVMVIESRPAENAVWVPGYWQWSADKSAYDWVAGTWRRPIPGMQWNTGKWLKVENGYEWTPGFWSKESAASTATETTATRLIVVSEAPPALKEETRSVSTSADTVWVPGSWDYENGAYAWSPGRWERPAASSMIWSPARWLHTAGGYRLAPGHWDYPVESRAYVISTEKRIID